MASSLTRLLNSHALCSMANLQRGRVHTLLTSTFSHQHAVHFVVNVYGMGLFGFLAADTLSSREVGVMISACGVSSSAAHVLCHPRIPVLGASGALMGLITVDALLQPEKRFNMVLPFPGLTLSMLQVADLALSANLIGFFLLRRYLGSVAWAAHLGGTAAGLGFGCGAWFNGDNRYGNPWHLHRDLCVSDWRQSAETLEASFDKFADFVERWR